VGLPNYNGQLDRRGNRNKRKTSNNRHPQPQQRREREDDFDYQGYIQDQYDQSKQDYDFQRRQNEEIEELFEQVWDDTELETENEMNDMI
jgi:hypothetical protein